MVKRNKNKKELEKNQKLRRRNKKKELKEVKEKEVKVEKIRVKKVGIHRKSIIFLWVFLIGSVCFGIYKNFTAIDVHTIHEKKVEKEKIVDTNNMESFVKDFAKVYHSWDNQKEHLTARENELQNFLTEELQSLNTDMIRTDCPTSSKVKAVEIWAVKKKEVNEYTVTYRIVQEIKEGNKKAELKPAYEVVVHLDNEENMVIVKNPTVCNVSGKSAYEPELLETDVSVKTEEIEEIEEFLNTFFKLYPTAEEKELAYYIKGKVMKPIDCKNYVFSEIVNPVYKKLEKGVEVNVAVKYLDQLTKTTQISEFDLILEKEDNWRIIERK